MFKRFFITGTDTAVGKTVVSRALLQALAASGKSVAGYKPVAKGSKETPEGLRNKDAPLIGWVANRINPGLAHYAEIIDVLSKKLPAPLIGELPYLPRAEQRELSQYVDLDVLGNVMAIDRIPA